jgi:hypothetical protein
MTLNSRAYLIFGGDQFPEAIVGNAQLLGLVVAALLRSEEEIEVLSINFLGEKKPALWRVRHDLKIGIPMWDRMSESIAQARAAHYINGLRAEMCESLVSASLLMPLSREG